MTNRCPSKKLAALAFCARHHAHTWTRLHARIYTHICTLTHSCTHIKTHTYALHIASHVLTTVLCTWRLTASMVNDADGVIYVKLTVKIVNYAVNRQSLVTVTPLFTIVIYGAILEWRCMCTTLNNKHTTLPLLVLTGWWRQRNRPHWSGRVSLCRHEVTRCVYLHVCMHVYVCTCVRFYVCALVCVLVPQVC